MQTLTNLGVVAFGFIIMLLPGAIIGFIAGLIVRKKYKIVGAVSPVLIWLVLLCVYGPSKMIVSQATMLNSTLQLIVGLFLLSVAGSIGGDWAKRLVERKRSRVSK
jgi:hypothetical protein